MPDELTILEIRDATPPEVTAPDYWLVWDESEYDGPDLVAVCRTSNAARSAAVTWLNAEPSVRWDQMYILGDTWDDVPEPSEETS